MVNLLVGIVRAGVQDAVGTSPRLYVIGDKGDIALARLPIGRQQKFVILVEQRHVEGQKRRRNIIPGGEKLRLLGQLPLHPGNIVFQDIPAIQKLADLAFLLPPDFGTLRKEVGKAVDQRFNAGPD